MTCLPCVKKIKKSLSFLCHTKIVVYSGYKQAYMSVSKTIKPTESELEILQILWTRGSATVREVHEELAQTQTKDVGYTTTLKLMQIMNEKGIVKRDDS